ncbi:uncharacterized protein LOC135496100 [Lineus longissimus]|uniref:uncharacterized protein LOC135496100 n=1 Tax=Lineus longissimus TaxID=88925 RepID=UPI00315D81C6
MPELKIATYNSSTLSMKLQHGRNHKIFGSNEEDAAEMLRDGEGRSTTSTICGQKVESIPDLLCEKTQKTNNQPGISVVTVAEVKKRGFKEKEEVDNKPWTRAYSKRRRIAHLENDKEVTDLSRHCRRGYVDDVKDKDEESEEEKEDKDSESDVANDNDLPSELKGQHASQLLRKLPYSCLGKNIFDRQRIMGLIIQGTHCVSCPHHYYSEPVCTHHQSVCSASNPTQLPGPACHGKLMSYRIRHLPRSSFSFLIWPWSLTPSN